MFIASLKTFSLPRRWLSLFGTTLVAVFVLSFYSEVHTAKIAVAKYVGIWEDDIARSKIFAGDTSLQDKILKQLHEVHGAVKSAELQIAESATCHFSSQIPVTYNSLPAGIMTVCYSTRDLGLRSLSSPLMMLGFFLAMLFLVEGLRREFAATLAQQKLQSELALNQEIADISRQVAHDIRGPLTALATLSRLSHEMPSDKKDLLELAVLRIQGIADDLLKRGGPEPEGAPSSAVKRIEDLLKQFRFSYPHIQISFHQHLQGTEFSIPDLAPIKLERILSNIFNNALEALPENDGVIDVTVMERQEHYLLRVMDNGCGIPEDVLPKILDKGFSFGKQEGHGLGLFDAHRTLRDLGGDLKITSRQGIGTEIILLFPKSRTLDEAL